MEMPVNYGFYNIEATLFCIASVAIILFKQLTVFNKDETQRAFTKILYIQLAYFVSTIIVVLVDIYVLPHTIFTVYVTTILNFALYSYCSYCVFVYLALYQKSPYFIKYRSKHIYELPLIINLAILVSSPLTGIYFSVNDEAQFVSGYWFNLIILINVCYPLSILTSSMWHNRKILKNIPLTELQITVAFPLCFIIFGPLSSIQWRMPFLVYGLTLADLFVYVYYTDLLMRERNNALEAEKELAMQQNKAKSTFLSNMSHDIRTPMNAIIGFTNLALSDPKDSERVGEYLGKIQASSNHLLSLINDVLEMSRIESGKIELEETNCSLPEILHDLNTIIVGQVESKQQELHMDAMNVIHENIYCDKLRLNQVLLNLLSNAVKYTQSGGKISVRVTEHDGAPSGYASYAISVKDNGMGMTPEFAAKVFEAFEREKNSTISGIQGTGLGMAITKKIVELMKGTIEVKTELGKGTEFIVRVNFKVQEGSAIDLHIASPKEMHALVVDDDFNACDSITKMLHEMSLRAEWTLSGKEAVLRAKQSLERGDPFDVFIIDWKLRDLDGIEVARQIRNIVGSDVPILLMTAYDWPIIRDEAVAAGVNGFCNKPLFMSELYNSLEKVLNLNPLSYNKTNEVEKSAETNISFAGKRLLLVDDIEVNREIATMMLQMNQFEVYQAANGEEAVNKIKNSEPGYYDVVLMDIQMPIMNGYEATKAIRALNNPELANIPIIAMTANAFDEDRKAALDAGMNGHIAKPIDIEKLLETLNNILK